MATLNDLTLKEKIGQMFMIGFHGTQVPEDAEEMIKANGIGSIILFARNIETVSQVKRLTHRLHSLGKIPPFIYTDQEGGTVVQFKEIAATGISAMGAAATGSPENARSLGRIIGNEMSSMGIDCVLGPCLDVNYEINNPIIGIRSYSDDPNIVIEFATAFADGLNGGGVAACGKHYPGHGGTTTDSHQEIPVVNISDEYFQHYCLSPFAALAKSGIDAFMTSHVRFPFISPSIASFCPHLLEGLLRKQCGFQGVIISDCMEMRAVKDNYAPADIVKNAVNAGVDIIIASHTPEFQQELMDALYRFVENGTISMERINQSVERILKLKQKYNKMTPSVEPTRLSDQQAGAADLPETLRPHLEEEREIARRSITLLRNRDNLIPIDPSADTLIIEWTKIKATMSISKAETISMLEKPARKYLDNVKIKVLDLAAPISQELRAEIIAAANVIVGIYTRMPEIGQLQADSLKEILKIRKDVIVVSMGNPYDIRNCNAVGTYLATYGFRQVQLEAFFDVLIGKVKASGKLPVHIKKIFPRGHSAPQ